MRIDGKDYYLGLFESTEAQVEYDDLMTEWLLKNADIGYLPADVLHLYHGSTANRKYRQRWIELLASGFDRDTDIEIDANGL